MLYLAPSGGASLRGVFSGDLACLGVCMDQPPTHFRPQHRPPACRATPAGPLRPNGALTSACRCARPAAAGSCEGARRGACEGSAGSSGANAGLGGAAGHCRRHRRSACPHRPPEGGGGDYTGLWGGGGVCSHVDEGGKAGVRVTVGANRPGAEGKLFGGRRRVGRVHPSRSYGPRGVRF